MAQTAAIADSTETALRELIQDEKVDRIIVLGTGGHYSNVTNWGYCWRDSAGRGVSSIDDTTYYECINDLADGCGPDNNKMLVNRLSEKPWSQLMATYPGIHDMARSLKPGAAGHVCQLLSATIRPSTRLLLKC